MNKGLSQNRGCMGFAGWALLIGGLLFLTSAVNQTRLPLFGKKTEGVITKIEEKTSYSNVSRRDGESRESYRERSRRQGTSTSYFCLVRYTPEGAEPVEFKTRSTFGHDSKEGDAVPVIYLPSNPMNAEINTAKQVWMPLAIGYNVSLVCIGLGWFLLKLKRAIPNAA
jgi:hypothetical protein